MIKIKMHQFPGDVSKSAKIAMMEDRTQPGPWSVFRRMIRSRLRAVLKERTRREVESALQSYTNQVG